MLKICLCVLTHDMDLCKKGQLLHQVSSIKNDEIQFHKCNFLKMYTYLKCDIDIFQNDIILASLYELSHVTLSHLTLLN